WAWGYDGLGQLGNGTSDESPHPTPTRVEGLTGAVAIAAGMFHALAIRGDGSVRAWGDDQYQPARGGDDLDVQHVRDAVLDDAAAGPRADRRRGGGGRRKLQPRPPLRWDRLGLGRQRLRRARERYAVERRRRATGPVEPHLRDRDRRGRGAHGRAAVGRHR